MPAPTEKSSHTILWVSLVLAALVLGCAAGSVGVYWYTHDNETTPPDNTPGRSADLDKVVALGRIEPKDGVLSLGVPRPDRIRDLKVHEGDTVQEGEALAILDSEVMRNLEKELAVIQLDQAKNRRDAIQENGDAQIHVEELRRDRIEELEPIELKTLESKLELLKAQERNAQLNYERYVAAGDTISDQDREKQKLARQQVQAEMIATQNQIDKLRKSSALNRRLADAQLKAAEAELKQTKSTISLELLDTQVRQANERLKETQVHAPSKGKILRILVRKGELVQAQPILQMANVDHMIVLTEVYETDIQRVQVGQKATITSHIFKEGKNPLSGKVVWIASSVGKAQVMPLDPRAAVDNRVLDVKVELDQPERVADLIGHQVRVEIHTDGSTEKAP
jgi:HlyD family secretion protein